MRIAIDIRSLDGAEFGGVSEYIHNLLPALFKAGNNHTFHLFSNSYSLNSKSYDFFQYPNVTLHQFRYPNKFFTISCRYIGLPKCDTLIGGADVFFSPHFLPLPLSKSCKRVTTFHDISFEYFPEFFDLKRRAWHRYISPSREAKHSDIIIAVSNSTKEDLIDKYNIQNEKIRVVYSGLDTKSLRSEMAGFNRVKRIYKLPDNYMLSFSTIEPRKNLVGLIKAFNVLAENEKFKDLKFVVAGSRGWAYKSILREVNKSPHKDRIIFTGPVKKEDKAHIYSHAKVFVYPSLYEGFGFPPLEAMYCSTPTLVSGVTSLPEVVGDGALLIDPYRPREIANVIEEVLSDEKLRDHLRERGLNRTKMFKWDKTAQETLKALESASFIHKV